MSEHAATEPVLPAEHGQSKAAFGRKRKPLVSAEAAMAAGLKLNEIRAKAGDCRFFLRSARAACGQWSASTIYGYMRIARIFGGVPTKALRMFDVSSMLLLSMNASSKEHVAAAISMAESGVRVTKEVAVEILSSDLQSDLWRDMLPENPGELTRVEFSKMIQKIPKVDFDRFKQLAYNIRDAKVRFTKESGRHEDHRDMADAECQAVGLGIKGSEQGKAD